MASLQKHFLLFLTECSLKQGKQLLANRTKAQLLAIREVVYNVIRGNVEVKPDQLKILKKNKNFLRQFAYKSVTSAILAKNAKVIITILGMVKSHIAHMSK